MAPLPMTYPYPSTSAPISTLYPRYATHATLLQLCQHTRRQQNDVTTTPTSASFGDWRSIDSTEQIIIEAWGEGFMLGALLIMAFITIANMRRRVLLHKLILLELLLAMSHGTFCFMSFRGYGWYLSSTAALLYCSYFVHNVVAWLKIAPFFMGSSPSYSPRVGIWVRRVFLGSLILTMGPLIFEIYNNFRFYNDLSRLYEAVRPYEPLFRDPWWLFSDLFFIHVIRKVYNVRVLKIVRKSPRFGILLLAIALAVIFTIMDILASIIKPLMGTDGINPYWKLALVFKCLTDNIMLDDFKSVLQRLGALKLEGDAGRTALGNNGLNLRPDEKAGATNDGDEHDRRPSHMSLDRWRTRAQNERANRMSFSGRLLDEGETLDENGYTINNENQLGRVRTIVNKAGIKARRLPHLPFSSMTKKRQQKWEAEREAELGAHNDAAEHTTAIDFADVQPSRSRDTGRGASMSGGSSVSPGPKGRDRVRDGDRIGNGDRGKSVEREPWDDMDFITALTDPDVDGKAPDRR